MKTKSDITKDFILKKTAIVFNKKGYAATSLSDLELATGLTKGAIYGNFESKEDLASKAFQYNVNKIYGYLKDFLTTEEEGIEKLLLITDFFKNNYDNLMKAGGCPILNASIDSKNVNPLLFKLGCIEAKKMENRLENIIQLGIDQGNIRQEINPSEFARIMYSMIEGSVFNAFTHQDKQYIDTMMFFLKDYIILKLKE
jgi:TetR/AcrR family transcriptional regulator, transcriptional repressor for nem operon